RIRAMFAPQPTPTSGSFLAANSKLLAISETAMPSPIVPRPPMATPSPSGPSATAQSTPSKRHRTEKLALALGPSPQARLRNVMIAACGVAAVLIGFVVMLLFAHPEPDLSQPQPKPRLVAVFPA